MVCSVFDAFVAIIGLKLLVGPDELGVFLFAV